MSDDDPRIRFTRPSKSQPEDKATIRTKTNDAPRMPPPQGVSRPAPNISPMGSMGIRPSAPPQQAQPPSNAQRARLAAMEVSEPTQDNSYYTDGRILNGQGYSFQAKMHDAPHKHGINGGLVEKLDVRKDGALVMQYDRGWVEGPKTAEEKEMVHRIREGFGDKQQKPFKGFDRANVKDHSMDR